MNLKLMSGFVGHTAQKPRLPSAPPDASNTGFPAALFTHILLIGLLWALSTVAMRDALPDRNLQTWNAGEIHSQGGLSCCRIRFGILQAWVNRLLEEKDLSRFSKNFTACTTAIHEACSVRFRRTLVVVHGAPCTLSCNRLTALPEKELPSPASTQSSKKQPQNSLQVP